MTSIILLIYEFIFYFAKVETFLTNKGIQFDNKDKPTFDMEIYEKDEKNTNTPLSNKNGPNPSDVKGSTNGESGNSQDNTGKENNPEVRDVQISNGYGNQGQVNNQEGFGF